METNQKSAKAKISPEYFMKVLCAESEAVFGVVKWNGILLKMVKNPRSISKSV
jgi:hypothetical protein